MNTSRKLQVFVSSTYLDLKAERQAAVEAILQAGHIPAGMELFAAGDASQWESIKRWIDDCDALMLLLGQRYGSIEPTSGKSYIHLEYEYALNTGKRVFALVLNDSWVDRKYKELGKDAADDFRTEHKAFKTLVLSKLSGPVEDEKDIKLGVAASLREIERDNTLGGWVRASEYAKSQALVNELRLTLEDLRSKTPSGPPSLAEIEGQLDGHMHELAGLAIRNEVTAQFQGDNEPRGYVLETNALALTYSFRDSLTGESGSVRIRSGTHNHWLTPFFEYVLPVLMLWQLVEWRTGYLYLTPRGELFASKLKKLEYDDESEACYRPL